jgi:hypothetical protein
MSAGAAHGDECSLRQQRRFRKRTDVPDGLDAPLPMPFPDRERATHGAGPAVSVAATKGSFVQLKKDIWRCAIVGAPAAEILASGSLDGWPLTWIPGSGDLRYLADPFGLWRDGRLYIFAEHFDYRDAVGRIAVSEYDQKLNLVRQAIVLREPWHLSYPFVFEANGETWLLPESFQSGESWLYRAVAFPDRWERAVRIPLDHTPLDATPYHDGTRWWLFYAPAFPPAMRLTALCAAYADRLEGPWHPHAANPILIDPLGARPGGTPIRHGGSLYLPVQGCTGTYGASVRLLRVDRLEPDRIVMTATGSLHAPMAAAPFVDGCHTLSAAGAVTLIDVKQTSASLRGLLVRPLRGIRRRARAAASSRW